MSPTHSDETLPILLVADPDDLVREMYQSFFPAHGFRVETAGEGAECLTKARDLSPAVLILDADLDWGGTDGAPSLQKQLGFLPAVVVTDAGGRFPFPDDGSVRISARFSKPYYLHEVLACLRSLGVGAEARDRMENKEPPIVFSTMVER